VYFDSADFRWHLRTLLVEANGDFKALLSRELVIHAKIIFFSSQQYRLAIAVDQDFKFKGRVQD